MPDLQGSVDPCLISKSHPPSEEGLQEGPQGGSLGGFAGLGSLPVVLGHLLNLLAHQKHANVISATVTAEISQIRDVSTIVAVKKPIT